MESNRFIQNIIDGSGAQNNNNGEGTQNVSFVNCFNTAAQKSHKTLWDAIEGVGASHNAEQQFSRGKCLEGTRKEVLRIIYDWIRAKGKKYVYPIFWLTGAAGVGKTAIAMTVAKSCENEDLLASSFFFFRSDARRNNPSAFILTIAHALASTSPLMRTCIETKISKDPRILEATMEVQFHELVVVPALTWSRQRSMWGAPVTPNVVVIDGLDECSDEETQMRILSIIQSAYQQAGPPFPLRFLICSRPEAWIREVFAGDDLGRLSKVVVLDETFKPNKDIERYYLHHFEEIARNPKYSQLRFPNPWPTRRDLEILIERTCGQFVYALTIIKYVTLAFRHPIQQLQIILDNAPHLRPRTSPYHQLDALYDLVLGVNPDYSEVLPILRAMLPSVLIPSPANIELLLELPMGQVTLTLRAMYSVLDIRGWGDGIRIYHTSFRDYLVDQTRSRHFHVDLDPQKYPIERLWLQSLATSKVRTLTPEQLYGTETKAFRTEWVKFCVSLEPTWDLLNDLWNVDFTSAYVIGRTWPYVWGERFRSLVPWVRGYHYHNQYETDVEECRLDSEGGLVHKLLVRPNYFHLERLLGVTSVQNDASYRVISYATGCRWVTRLFPVSPPSAVDDVGLTDCRCNLFGGNESRDPGHLAYQEACLQYVQASISLFEKLAQRNASAPRELSRIFLNVTQSSLLKHCRLDMELLSLCRAFFGLAKFHPFKWPLARDGTDPRWAGAELEKARDNVLEWIEVSTVFLSSDSS
ncbi:hypothetical protein PQX77_010530 [Marasmius sp. AFHP31]|nr:hypothetical protein PQX77_010530 [Marasmius sp. AFHP31]